MNPKILKENDFYSTTDLGLAGAINCYYPLEGIDYHDPKEAQFLFKKERELDKLIESYWQKELKIDAQTYYIQLRILKNRLYEEKKKQN